MKNKFNFLLLGALLLSSVVLGSCGGPDLEGEKVKYTITLSSINGKKRLPNVEVGLYAGRRLIASGVTGGNGTATISTVPYNYTVKFKNLPDSYYVESSFKTEGDKYSYVYKLPSTVPNKHAPDGYVYTKGDVVYDFDVVDSDGKNFSFYDEFKKYDMFLINFFYVDCYYCQLEFQVLKEVIKGYEDKVGIICIDVLGSDTNNYINQLKTAYELPFRMAKEGDSNLVAAFGGIPGTPSTVVVDRYGLYSEMIEGYYSDHDFFVEKFIEYTMPSYIPR